MTRRGKLPSHPRRTFLGGSAALAAGLLLPVHARAAQIRTLEGTVTINGQLAKIASVIKPGDVLTTAAGARVAFVVGQDAFLMREQSRVELKKSVKSGSSLIGGLQMLSGGLLAVFGKGSRTLTTPTATIGLRGSGVYLEASEQQTYLCTCYGEAEVRDSHAKQRRTVLSAYHTPLMIYAAMEDGRMMSSTEMKNHTDDELIRLEAMVGRVSPVKSRAKPQGPEQGAASTPAASSTDDAAQAAPKAERAAGAEAAQSSKTTGSSAPAQSVGEGVAPAEAVGSPAPKTRKSTESSMPAEPAAPPPKAVQSVATPAPNARKSTETTAPADPPVAPPPKAVQSVATPAPNARKSTETTAPADPAVAPPPTPKATDAPIRSEVIEWRLPPPTLDR